MIDQMDRWTQHKASSNAPHEAREAPDATGSRALRERRARPTSDELDRPVRLLMARVVRASRGTERFGGT